MLRENKKMQAALSKAKKKHPSVFNKENTHALDNLRHQPQQPSHKTINDEEERGDLRKSKDFQNQTDAELPTNNKKLQVFQYQQQTPEMFNESATLHTQFANSASASQSFVFQGQMHHYPLTQVMDFSVTSNIPRDTLDSNEIKGRKIDSPRLVVVREIKEAEEDDYLTDEMIQGFNTDENNQFYSRDLRNQQPATQNLNDSQKRQKSKTSKSVENKRKMMNKQLNTKPKVVQEPKQQKRLTHKGTISTREIRSSMGFHELLNQLDKDVSIQQSNLADFKNRTVHDALKLELSGIRRQSASKNRQGAHKSVQKNNRNKSRSKDKLPKKQTTQVFQYTFNNIQQTPEKHQGPTAVSFLNSEHGRCVTAQGLHTNNSMLLGKGHTKSQTHIGTSSHNLIGTKLANYPQTASHYNQRHSNSPDRTNLHQIKEFKPIGNIDKLIRENLKKKNKQDTKEKLMKQKSEETLRRKREELELKNHIVRQINKDKTYKKQSATMTIQQQQQAQDQQQMMEQPEYHQFEKFKRQWNEATQLKQKVQQRQQQTIDASSSMDKRVKKFNFKNQRKSYGLEFIDIKREIQDELKTIEEKVYQENNIMQRTKLVGHSEPARRIKIRQSTKQEVIEKRSSTERAINKVIIVKKDKIRKFMKAKKKELIHQQYQQQKEELIKAQKMQDNLTKLNQFCKKKTHKHPSLKLHKKRNATIQVKDFILRTQEDDYARDQSKVSLNKKDIQRQRSQDVGEDSSKISTEFYEEYFRLINSIKKEEGSQKKRKPLVTQESLDLDRSLAMLQKSKSTIKSPSRDKKIQSPTNKQTSPSNKKGMQKSKSKGSQVFSGGKKRIHVRPPTVGGVRKNSKGFVNIKGKALSANKRSRAESAPLVQQMNSLNHRHQSPRRVPQIGNSSERLQYLLQQIVKIQRAYRNHLHEKGFYRNFYFNASEYDTEYYAGDTVKRIDTMEAEDEEEEYKQDEEDQEEGEEDYHQSEEEEEDEEGDDLIIIHKKEDNDDERKIVYMSNINSCSLPQTPKEGLQQRDAQTQIVFEYKVGEDQFNSVQSPPIQQISQQPSIFAQEAYQTQQQQQPQVDQEEIKQDGYKMRILTGSESMVKEFNRQQQRTPKEAQKDQQKSLTSSVLSNASSVRNVNNLAHGSVDSKLQDHTSLSSQSVFERNSFQQFTMSKLNQISQNNEFFNLIKMREQALEYRQMKEGKILKKMKKKNQISPRTYIQRKEQLEKWVKVEEEDIQKTKKAFQEEWQKTVQMIEDTQKNVDMMRKTMKIDNQTKHSQFNTYSSRNSSCSNLNTVQQEKRRSILEEEPPISSRSIRALSFEQAPPKKEQRLIDFLEERRIQKLNDSSEILQVNNISSSRVGRQGIYIEDQNVLQASEDFESVVDTGNKKIVVENVEEDKSFQLETTQKGGAKSCRQEELKIEENIYGNQNEIGVESNRLSIGQFEDNLDSNKDSILNESDFNNYFQEQKFSIEDFKSLDKKQLFVEQNSSSQEEIKQHQVDQQTEPVNNFQRHQAVVTEPDDDDFERLEAPLPQRAQTPEDLINPAFHQNSSHILFTNAKPGENIKISDILRKSQGIQLDQIYDPILFQNQQISTQINQQPSSSALADEITEQILQMLLSQSLQVPSRIPSNDHQLPQQIDQDVFVIDVQQNEKDQKRELVEFRQRYLMEQDMQKVDLYINEVIATMLQSELDALQYDVGDQFPAFHKQFLQVLTNPVQRNRLDMLHQLQTSEIGSYDHFETAQELQQYPILPIDLYLEIERLREENQIKINGELDNLETSVVQESIHIMNKAIFDALNESLTKFRPYGIQGEPMPWSNKNRRLQTKVDINSVDTERLFQLVKQDVLRWSQTFAGCIPSQVFSFKKNVEEQFDEELFQETRERRLAQMLASEVVETEHQWLNYDFEEAQVKIDLSDMILEHLVEETVRFLSK